MSPDNFRKEVLAKIKNNFSKGTFHPRATVVVIGARKLKNDFYHVFFYWEIRQLSIRTSYRCLKWASENSSASALLPRQTIDVWKIYV